MTEWTKEPPKEEGFYPMKKHPASPTTIAEVWQAQPGGEWFVYRIERADRVHFDELPETTLWWSTPIEVPK